MLLSGVDLAESRDTAFRHEDRIIAKAALAARRPDELARDLAAEELEIAIGPSECQHRDEPGTPIPVAELAVHALQGNAEILGGTRPAGGVDARSAPKLTDDEAGIIGDRRQPARGDGGLCLQRGVRSEAVAGFFGFRNAERGR